MRGCEAAQSEFDTPKAQIRYHFPALLALGRALKKEGYRFTAVTPLTHSRVLDRGSIPMNDGVQVLRALFGWNVPVPEDRVPDRILRLMIQAGVFAQAEKNVCSRVRFASLDEGLYAHSSYPTVEESSVFFGPDSYRFAAFVYPFVRESRRLVDLGSGCGVGALEVALRRRREELRSPERLYLADVNRLALDFAAVNAELNEIGSVELCEGAFLKDVPPGADAVIANPPFIIDDEKERRYRHGGENFGAQVTGQMVRAAMEYLPRDGRMALYTGGSVVAGKNVILENVRNWISDADEITFAAELDPDIFGEELERPAYRAVERIAATGVCVRKG